MVLFLLLLVTLLQTRITSHQKQNNMEKIPPRNRLKIQMKTNNSLDLANDDRMYLMAPGHENSKSDDKSTYLRPVKKIKIQGQPSSQRTRHQSGARDIVPMDKKERMRTTSALRRIPRDTQTAQKVSAVGCRNVCVHLSWKMFNNSGFL